MKEYFKIKEEGNWFQRLIRKWSNWHIKGLFTCPLCHKGEIVNKRGYFECTVCNHKFRGQDNG